MTKWTGELHLDVENRQGKTVAKNIFFQGAFKVMRPIYHNRGNMPCYYLLNPGGGYLDGDRYCMNITVEENAALTLTTQSSTKVYKTPTKEVYQASTFHLKKASYLEYLPDALIAYQDAKYYQQNTFHLEDGATLLYSDILTPGWSPEKKQFSYDRLRLKNEIYYEGELVLFDHVKLAPHTQELTDLGFMEGYTHLGSFIVIGDEVNEALIDSIHEAIEETCEGDFSFGISTLPIPGFTIRIMANYTQVIESIISVSHHIISETWYDKKPSFLRKY